MQASLNKYPMDFMLWQILGDANLRLDQLQDALSAYIHAEDLLG
jgi:cytochrome c-type biogenesis protein CcmH/NrfG